MNSLTYTTFRFVCLTVGFFTITMAAAILLGSCIKALWSRYIYYQVRRMDRKIDNNITHMLKDMYDGQTRTT